MLGIGSETLVLLDSKTKLLLKSYPASELHGWQAADVGRRRGKYGLTLEFRGTNKSPWTVVAQSADAFRSVTAALWDMIGVGNQPADNTIQRPFNADLLDFSMWTSIVHHYTNCLYGVIAGLSHNTRCEITLVSLSVDSLGPTTHVYLTSHVKWTSTVRVLHETDRNLD